jgi:hypothetical protein
MVAETLIKRRMTVTHPSLDRGPVICLAGVEPHRRAIGTDDQSIAVMLDLVNPFGSRGRMDRFHWLGRQHANQAGNLRFNMDQKICSGQCTASEWKNAR